MDYKIKVVNGKLKLVPIDINDLLDIPRKKPYTPKELFKSKPKTKCK